MIKMNEEKWEVIKNKFERTLGMWEIDKKCGQFTTDSIQHLFPLEIEVIINYIDELQNNWNELKGLIDERIEDCRYFLTNADVNYEKEDMKKFMWLKEELQILKSKAQELEQGKDE